jgi:hypothetical protein
MNKKTYVDEAIACFYSSRNCQILIGGIDENQVLIIHTQIVREPAILAEVIKLLSDYSLPIWINSHEPLKRNLPGRIAGELSFGQENEQEREELHDLYESLIATQQIEDNVNLEGQNAQSCLQILIKAIGMELYVKPVEATFWSDVGETRNVYSIFKGY